MPYCPSCNCEYRPGTRRCSDCDVDLLEGSPPSPSSQPAPPDENAPVRLCHVPDPTEAQIVRAALAEAGIRSVLQIHGPITARLTTVADGATHDFALIFVSRKQLAAARAVLAEIAASPVVWPEGMEPQDEEDPAD